jgi:pimeloyl-ACP methyl ester carboxylesterase
VPSTTANGITIEYEDDGDSSAPPILLVMGLGSQLTAWPTELVDALVARGFRVIRYDNRDVGLSTRFDTAAVPNLKWLLVRSRLGQDGIAPVPGTENAPSCAFPPTGRELLVGSGHFSLTGRSTRALNHRQWHHHRI